MTLLANQAKQTAASHVHRKKTQSADSRKPSRENNRTHFVVRFLLLFFRRSTEQKNEWNNVNSKFFTQKYFFCLFFFVIFFRNYGFLFDLLWSLLIFKVFSYDWLSKQFFCCVVYTFIMSIIFSKSSLQKWEIWPHSLHEFFSSSLFHFFIWLWISFLFLLYSVYTINCWSSGLATSTWTYWAAKSLLGLIAKLLLLPRPELPPDLK